MGDNRSQTISVIVPLYNQERYLDACLRSITNQTYNNLDIIVVNDGSTDDSLAIAEKWAEKDHRIKVIDKPNEGVTMARRDGYLNASGEYIAFVDSDDWIKPTMFELLMSNAIKYNAEVVSCRHIYYYSDGKMELSRSGENVDTVYNSFEAKRHLYTNFSFWGKIFRRFFFNDIRFPEGKLYEDSRTMYRIALEVTTYVSLSSHEYYYRQRPTSIMGTFTTQNYLDRVSVWDEIYAGVKDVFPQEELTEIKRRQGRLALELLKSIVYNKKLKDNRELISQLLEKLPDNQIMNYTLKDRVTLSLCKLYS